MHLKKQRNKSCFFKKNSYRRKSAFFTHSRAVNITNIAHIVHTLFVRYYYCVITLTAAPRPITTTSHLPITITICNIVEISTIFHHIVISNSESHGWSMIASTLSPSTPIDTVISIYRLIYILAHTLTQHSITIHTHGYLLIYIDKYINK